MYSFISLRILYSFISLRILEPKHIRLDSTALRAQCSAAEISFSVQFCGRCDPLSCEEPSPHRGTDHSCSFASLRMSSIWWWCSLASFRMLDHRPLRTSGASGRFHIVMSCSFTSFRMFGRCSSS